MSKYILNTLCTIIVGTIVLVICTLAQKYGANISYSETMTLSFLSAITCWALLIPAISERIKHICCDYDWADETVHLYQSISPKYRQSFWTLFGLINLAFLFHTINFMWGNEDWAAIRSTVNHEESLKIGAFSAYWLQELLFDGKILPVINNLWSFAGLSLAGVLLAIYWNAPERATPIVTIGLLFAVTPYTLSILYFAKTSLGVCWLPALVLTGLLLAEKKCKNPTASYLCNTLSILLITWALGTYMPVINFLGLAIIGQIFLKVTYADISLKSAFTRNLQGIANTFAAIMLYLLILFTLEETNYLNADISDSLRIGTPLLRLPLLIKHAFLQFAEPLPFMDITYKAIYIVMCLFGLFTLILKAPNAKAAIRGLILIPVLLFCSMLALLFAIYPETNYARMTFFGLPFLYALLFLLIIELGSLPTRRIAYTLAFILIFMNFVRIAYAEKVWKFGWDAETKLAERIITRLEKMPEFNIERQYKLLQIGEKSLRGKYYRQTPYERMNGELLERAYYPAGNAKDAYNFFYQADFLSADASAEALREPVIREYLLNKARAWPQKEALFIHGDYIVLILDDKSLAAAQSRIQ